MINNANISSNMILTDVDNDVIILPIPLFHSFALTCGAQVAAVKGVKTVLTGYRFIVKDVVDAIQKYNGSFLMCTPTMIIDIINYIKKNQIKVPTLKTILTGAASFPPELYNSIKEVIDLQDLRCGYGMTSVFIRFNF